MQERGQDVPRNTRSVFLAQGVQDDNARCAMMKMQDALQLDKMSEVTHPWRKYPNLAVQKRKKHPLNKTQRDV